jgi:S-layer homology domain
MSRWKPAYSLVLAGFFFASLSARPAAARPPDGPQSFGTSDYTVTVVSAAAFFPEFHLYGYATSGSLGRFGDVNAAYQFLAGLDLPGGAVIDFVGLNSTTDTDAVLTAGLYNRHKDGTVDTIVNVPSTVHGWDTNFNAAPLGYVWNGQTGNSLILNIAQASNPNPQFFGFVEIWWKRSVSPAPATASFTDVPTDHQFFQFIEALKASGITGGCGPAIYCPDAPVTRGQMATFIAKALGLHWPGATAPPAPPTAHE